MGQQHSRQTAGPSPIWLAALVATGCQAVSDRECHPIGWDWAEGRALYTNAAGESQVIHPLDVTLAAGETLSVTWAPGDTAYTLNVDSAEPQCA
jgi:hypothetical protein